VPVIITSADDERIADYVGLRERQDSHEYVIAESPPVVERLLTSPFFLRSFLFTPKGYERMQALVEPSRVPVYVAEPEVIESIVGFHLHRGVLASAKRRPFAALGDVLARSRRVVVLEASNDHENIGVVARSARALGFDALILSPTCADPYYRRSVRVSMGEILHLPIVKCGTWPAPIATMARYGFETWALTPDAAADSLFTMGMPEKVALIAGAEGPGLTTEALEQVQHRVRIPMHRGVDSLNLGHALAIAMAATSPPVAG
jgi:tRNA G18 (ribose-2'-O)-methylase SpoU